MKRNYEVETRERVAFIKNVLMESGSKGIVFGNSGGKDCALVGILCIKATEKVTGLIMPCGSKQNYGQDLEHAIKLAKLFKFDSKIIDLSKTYNCLIEELEKHFVPSNDTIINIPPRLRMSTLYAYAASHSMLVAGTGNKSERFVGYFTKWGDGGCDFNPISDLAVTEVFEFLEYLKAPREIIEKKPSAGLFDGQTDEADMGVKYEEIDNYINGKEIDSASKEIIQRMHKRSRHKIKGPTLFNNDDEH